MLVSPPDALAISPATNLIFSGPVGGPFGPGARFSFDRHRQQRLWLERRGQRALGRPESARRRVVSGIAPNSGLAHICSPAAASLPPGSYAATVSFTNFSTSSVQKRGVVLDVVTPPIILTQPVNQTVPTGATVTFSVNVPTNALLFYQWHYNSNNLADGGNVSGSSTGALTLRNVTSAGNAGTYQVIVSNAAGVVASRSATLAVTSSAPFIVSQPASQVLPQGQTAFLSVVAGGTPPLSFQWRWNSTNLSDGGTTSGSSTSALTIENLTPATAGSYSVLVSNALGVTTSSNALLAIQPLTASGVTLSILYSFTGETDGANPNGLMQDTNGEFYGTTQAGGTNAAGTVFQMSPAGVFTTVTLLNDIGADGYSPAAGLVQGPDGNLYGTTSQGGVYGWGTIFGTTTNGVVSTLVNFAISSSGAVPDATLILGTDGALYGTTQYGGPNGAGTAFRVTTNGTFATLAAFNYSDGSEPNQLLQVLDGNFYGTTPEGGLNGNGTVFEIITNGRLASLNSFNYTNGGSLPAAGLVQTPDGNFWGTTYEGGTYGYGAIFEMSPVYGMTTIYSFTGGSDGNSSGGQSNPGQRWQPLRDGGLRRRLLTTAPSSAWLPMADSFPSFSSTVMTGPIPRPR